MKTKRSAEDQALLQKLATMSEEDIDTSDIPVLPAENWALARRPGLYRPIKKPVTLRLDVDLVEWFKSHAPEGGYQTEINRVLRRYVAEAGR
jgi:uncharacterized protein (DUF4415 family)